MITWRLDEFLRLREGAGVTRFHTARCLRSQSVGEHSHGVAMIVMAIAPASPKHLILAALTHDLAEIETGDVPATSKWRNEILKKDLELIEGQFNRLYGIDWELTRSEEHILKWADMFELVLWAQEELTMGNRYMRAIRERGIKYLLDIGSPTTQASILLNEFLRTLPEEDNERE